MYQNASITIFEGSATHRVTKRISGGTRKIGELPQTCRHPEHFAAGMIVRPPGIYHHTCPGCGYTYTFEEHGGPTC